MGEKAGDERELVDGVMTPLDTISRDELEAFFDEVLVTLDTSMQRGGEYVESDKLIKQGSILLSLSYRQMLNRNRKRFIDRSLKEGTLITDRVCQRLNESDRPQFLPDRIGAASKARTQPSSPSELSINQ
jgi:hypothetical protein